MPPLHPPPDRDDPAQGDRGPRQDRPAVAHPEELRHLRGARAVARLQRHQAHADVPPRLPAPHALREEGRLERHEEGDGGAGHQLVTPYAEIAVPAGFHATLTYAVPEPLRDAVRL